MKTTPTDQRYEREASYRGYQIDLEKLYYHKLLRAIRRFSRNENGRLLDIGCWDGSFSAQLLNVRECYGIEGNIDAAARAKQRGIKVENVDVEKGLPFADKFFDVVVAAEVIEHVYDTDLFLREIRRVLADDGLLVMSIPNIACLSNRIGMLFGKYPRYAEYKAGGAGHIRVYTAKVIRDQLIENGFNVVHYVGCNLPLPMHSTFIPRWIKRIAAEWGDYFPGIAGQYKHLPADALQLHAPQALSLPTPTAYRSLWQFLYS